MLEFLALLREMVVVGGILGNRVSFTYCFSVIH